MKILKKWQEKCDGDSFIFDYYLWRPHLDYLNPMGLARIINQDIKDLHELGLNGLMNCQALRSFYPMGLEMNVMADTLWDRNAVFADVVSKVLETAYGSAAGMVSEYLEALENLLYQDPKAHVGTLRAGSEARISALIDLLDKWEERINALDENADQYAYNLKHYHKFLRLKAQASLSKSRGDDDRAKHYADAAMDHIKQTEENIHSYLDAWLALQTVS